MIKISYLFSAVLCLSLLSDEAKSEPVSTSEEVKIRAKIATLSIRISSGEARLLPQLKKMAIEGNSDAQETLAFLYRVGSGIPKDSKLAIAWYQKSARQGNVRGQRGLAEMYWHGIGIPENDVEAAKWYSKAADQGDPDSQVMMSLFSRTGSAQVQKNYEKSFEWIVKAADQGNISAQAMAGFMYMAGMGVKQSKVHAVKWLLIAKASGDKDAAHMDALNEYKSTSSQEDLAESQELAAKWWSAHTNAKRTD